MADKLTSQQKLAVANRGGQLLVSAAAGSGKTKVLVERLISYILDPSAPANIDDFLIITYTNAAAAELREKISTRLSELLAENPNNRHLQQQLQRIYLAKISTVHAFCADILRENAYRLDLPSDFRVAEENECTEIKLQVLEKVLESAYANLENDVDFRTFADTQGFGRDDRKIPEIVLSVYNAAMCHLDPKQWLSDCITAYQTEGISDPSQSQWGMYLLEDLRWHLQMQIDALSRCIVKANALGNMERAAALLTDTCKQLELLYRCKTWEEVRENRNISYGTLSFTKKADPELKERIKAVRNACKDSISKKLEAFYSSGEQVLLEFSACEASVRGLVNLVKEFSKAYSAQKLRRRILDYSDLEHKVLDLLYGTARTAVTNAAYEIGERFREVMVDEYQDTNAVQDAIFAALTKKRNNIFMVGDVKQSIYRFRLAEPEIFLNKYNTFTFAETAKPGEGRKALLSANFRSCNDVISAVNAVFSNCMSPNIGGLYYNQQEQLNAGREYIPIDAPEVIFHTVEVEADTYAEEASVVAEEILHMLQNGTTVREKDVVRPVKPEDIVILLRSPNSVGGEFAHALAQRGICCQFGEGKNLLQTEAVSFLRALLQVIDNPLQDIPLTAIMMSRIFGFTADDMAVIRCLDRRVPIYSLLLDNTDKKVSEFVATIQKLRDIARFRTVTDLIEEIFTKTRLDSIFRAVSNTDNEGLQTFLQLAGEAERVGRWDLHSFLSYIDALEAKGINFGTDSRLSGAVTILSIHKSKGLEYPVVFLSGLSKAFNSEDLKEQVLCDKELHIGLTCVDIKNRVRYPSVAKRAIAVKKLKDGISEELRVLYVAMTRAKDRLIMTYASKYLDSALSKIALRTDLSSRELMTSDVSSMGEWVLQTAMTRIEAGALFARAGRPDFLTTSEPYWKIDICHASKNTVDTQLVQQERKPELPAGALEKIKAGLAFSYPYLVATNAQSKRTATSLKGRRKDQEAAEYAPSQSHRYAFRKPRFADRTVDAMARGTAMHKALALLRVNPDCTMDDLENSLSSMCKSGNITKEDLSMLDKAALLSFYHSQLGKRVLESENVLREFKFSILEDAAKYDSALEGEKILLQGVVDCAILEKDGITVIDFKTDRVTDATIFSVTQQYRAQIHAYADALSRIYALPIKERILCFLHDGRTVTI